MNKNEFVQRVARVSGLSVRDARRAIDAIFATEGETPGVIAAGLVASQKLTLPGFGTFETRSREARDGRNPRTKEVMRIPASKYPSFRPGKNLKALVRG